MTLGLIEDKATALCALLDLERACMEVGLVDAANTVRKVRCWIDQALWTGNTQGGAKCA